jgi:hypothetical protein
VPVTTELSCRLAESAERVAVMDAAQKIAQDGRGSGWEWDRVCK